MDLAHSRRLSSTKFTEDTVTASAKAMQFELGSLISSAPTELQQHFGNEMTNFQVLFNRFVKDSSQGQKLDWQHVKNISPEKLISYSNLPRNIDNSLLGKLAVLKLNGGLGTTMGCVGPKSAIEVREGMTFLDLTVRQIEYLNQTKQVDVPLILMNSFNTNNETKKIIQKYSQHKVDIITFNQSRFPRIGKDSLLPLPNSYDANDDLWYPPGHGNVFDSLHSSGLLDELLTQGKEYIFISNIDNLGATVDLTILKHMEQSGAEFIMEVTDKTRSDVKGGTLIEYGGNVRLLEIAQVPTEHLEDFTSIKKFKFFNTNNIWVSLKAIQRLVLAKVLNMDVIINHKTVESTGEKCIQLETAVGSAIQYFESAHGVVVPRDRFLPVKSCSDLFIIQSDLYSLSHGALTMNPKRMFNSIPLVKLGDHFKKVPQYLCRFNGPPQILELDHLTVTGDVTFGYGVQLKGTVIIVANHGARIDIAAGTVLDNKVVSGNLRILDH